MHTLITEKRQIAQLPKEISQMELFSVALHQVDRFAKEKSSQSGPLHIADHLPQLTSHLTK